MWVQAVFLQAQAVFLHACLLDLSPRSPLEIRSMLVFGCSNEFHVVKEPRAKPTRPGGRPPSRIRRRNGVIRWCVPRAMQTAATLDGAKFNPLPFPFPSIDLGTNSNKTRIAENDQSRSARPAKVSKAAGHAATLK